MARIRTIKPEFWTDEKIVELTPWARLLFLGLLNFADDNGRLVNSQKRIKMQVLPADSVSIQELLTELGNAGFLLFYSVNNIDYIQIVNFTKHQKVNRPSHTTIPAPESSLSHPGGKGREGKGMEGKKTKSSLRSDSQVLDLRLPPEDQESTTPSERTTPAKTPAARAFDAYAATYAMRYNTPPVVNAKVRGQFTNLVKRLGDEAVEVAGFYPTHQAALYVRSGHAVDLLLRDCEKLRTEWATGRRITETGARQADRTGTMSQHAHELIEEQRHGRN